MEQEQTNNKKILVIEDEHFIGELYTRALNKNGYTVKVIADGIEALKECQTDQYDLILLDLMIPNMTGFEILNKLKDPSTTSPVHAKIIITTNLEQRDEIKKEIEKKADAYLIKANLTPNELVDFLSQVK
jgi:CheY-like chemotaxis protein